MLRTLSTTCLLSLSVTVAQAGPPTVDPPAEYRAVVAELESVIGEQLEQKQIPCLSIALVDGDRVVWARGFGFARGREPATAATVYRVGSVSKLFTDIAVMQLVAEQKLSLDAPVSQYLPKFQPPNPTDRPITLRQLMSHRSGLVREPPVGHYFDPDEPTLEQTVLSLNQSPLVYPPASRTKYSNAGVSVVGLVLERMGERPFSELMKQQVLQPLAMDDSSFVARGSVAEQLAEAKMWTYDGRRFEAPTFALGTAPAGNLYANVVDLGKFARAVLNEGRGERGELLAQLLAQMMQPQLGPDSGFGLGFHLQQLDGRRMIGHGGAVYGFSTQLEVLPDQRLAAIAAASLDGCNGVVRRITDHSLRCLLARRAGQPLPEFRRTGPVPPQRARRLDGRYVAPSGDALVLRERNGRLLMDYDARRRELRTDGRQLVADDVFGFGPRITSPGRNRLQIGDTVYTRQETSAPAELPPRWRGIVGQYGWDHNELFVFEEQGRLHCLIEWFYDYPLQELSENEFAFPDYGLYHGEKLVFQRTGDDPAGHVIVAGVRFQRRPVGVASGETFQIKPVKPIDELRSAALAAEPPAEPGEFREPELVDLTKLEPGIRLDIRYATTNNFMGAVFYQQGRAFMQKPAAEAVARAHRQLAPHGLGLLIHDAYRPWHVTKMFWDATPSDMKIFVANPANGSRHNRGCAVDLTLCDLQTGEPIDMGAGYDEFSPRSFPDYQVDSSRARWHRELLRDVMEQQGFTIYEHEWWHFDYRDWKQYRILNKTFEEL